MTGILAILAAGCFATPEQQLARSSQTSGANQGGSPAWSRNFVPTGFGGASVLLNPNYKVVQAWRMETNGPNQVVQVPYDVIEDAFGRPVAMPSLTTTKAAAGP